MKNNGRLRLVRGVLTHPLPREPSPHTIPVLTVGLPRTYPLLPGALNAVRWKCGVYRCDVCGCVGVHGILQHLGLILPAVKSK